MEKTVENLREKSDIFIHNVLNQPDSFSKEMFAAAKIVYQERNLGTPEKIDQIEKIGLAKKRVFDDMVAGKKPEKSMDYMKSLGLSHSDSLDIFEETMEKAKKHEKIESNSSGTIIGGIFIIYVIIKIILRFMSSV